MNLQSRTLSVRNSARRRTAKPATRASKFYTISYFLMMAALIFGIATYRIHLSRQINDLQKATQKTTAECKDLDLDIQSLKLQRDELTSADYIQSQIAAYHLQLRAPAPNQIRYLTVKYRNDGESAPRVAAGHGQGNASNRLSLAHP